MHDTVWKADVPRAILLATDLSEHCGAAAKWTQQFREATGARVYVQHVIELSVSTWLTSAFETLEDEEATRAAEEKIAAWYEEHTGARPDEVLLRAGSCFVQISEAARSLPRLRWVHATASGVDGFLYPTFRQRDIVNDPTQMRRLIQSYL